jgi:lysine 2,3-aminomutase
MRRGALDQPVPIPAGPRGESARAIGDDRFGGTESVRALHSAVRTVADLGHYLDSRDIDRHLAGIDRLDPGRVLPLRVPTYYLDLIDWLDLADPLRRQVLPDTDEHTVLDSELVDPIGDDAHSPVPGIVHRYPDRALFFPTMACAVHCRFCFRREFVGKPIRTLRREQYDRAIDYIGAHPEIWEVILSGGDPLVLTDAYLEALFTRLRSIPHLKVIRLHTRVPAVLPGRLTTEFAEMARRYAPLFIAIHVNHAREVTPEFASRVGILVDHGIPVLSQSVLMRGVNDSTVALADLFRKLVEARVKPYYLHQLDMAPGTNHFRVPIEEGLRITRALRGAISGLCQPTYVLDIPEGYGKVPLDSAYVHPRGHLTYDVTTYRGEALRYVEPGTAEIHRHSSDENGPPSFVSP